MPTLVRTATQVAMSLPSPDLVQPATVALSTRRAWRSALLSREGAKVPITVQGEANHHEPNDGADVGFA